MDPVKWGPHGWYFIQACIVHMPENADPSDYVNFLYSLRNVLPCGMCRENYSKYLDNNPVPTSREGMIQWVTDLQNSIRIKSGKIPRSAREVEEFYTKEMNIIPFLIIAGAIALLFLR